MLKSVEFVYLFVISGMYMLIPCRLFNLYNVTGWFSVNLEESENSYGAILRYCDIVYMLGLRETKKICSG
jgi:hypothetical protein